MGIFSSCMSSDVRSRTKQSYDAKSPLSSSSKTSFPILINVNPKAGARAGVTGDSNTTLHSPSSNTHTLATRRFDTGSPQKVKPGQLPPLVRSGTTSSKVGGNNSILDQMPPVLREIVFQYLLTPIPMLRRSLGELDKMRDFIRFFPKEGYQRLATWLASKILAGPKGRMCQSTEGPLSYFHYQKSILENITDVEASYLKDFPEIVDHLSLQKNIRTILSRKIIKQLVLLNEERSYQVLARLIGKSEFPLYATHEAGVLRNSLEGQEELTAILSDNALEQIVMNADLMEAIDLNASFATSIFNRAWRAQPAGSASNSLATKGLALFCRSLSNPAICPHSGYDYDGLVKPIAEGFIAHLTDVNKPRMTMTLNSPLWKDIHNRLKTMKPSTEIDYAMEWFIAGLNLMATVNCDLLSCLELANYSLTDLTQDMRNKITYLCLEKTARKTIPKIKNFISTFNNLQVLRLTDDSILWLPLNCKNLRRLTLCTPQLKRLLAQMSHLEYLYMEYAAVLPVDLPKLKVYIGIGDYGVLPKMPLVETLQISGDNELPDAPHLKRLVVCDNNIVTEIKGNFQLEVLGLKNCPKLTRLFSQITPEEIPDKLGTVQPHLHHLRVTGTVGDPSLKGYCKEWKRQWMNNAF